MGKLNVGDVAPEFSLPDKDGKDVTLSQFKDKILVLFFYPKDGTPGCTAEACEFRDKYDQFIAAGADVVGVSSDGAESHQKFSAKHKLQYHLITDHKGELAKSYGVGKDFFLLPGRTTFIIHEGKIASEYNSAMKPTSHIEEALKCIESLKSKK